MIRTLDPSMRSSALSGSEPELLSTDDQNSGPRVLWDDHVTRSSIRCVSTDRTFQTSRIVPYAANLLLVLYDCQRGPRLQMLLNETPLRFPGLPEDAPLYRDVRAAYRHLLDGCDFHAECEGRAGGRGPSTEL